MTDRNGHWERETGTGSPGKVPPPPPPPPVKCAVCGRSSRIAGYLGSDVCSMACQWRAEGAAAERARLVTELRRVADVWHGDVAPLESRGCTMAAARAKVVRDTLRAVASRFEGELPTTEGDDE